MSKIRNISNFGLASCEGMLTSIYRKKLERYENNAIKYALFYMPISNIFGHIAIFMDNPYSYLLFGASSLYATASIINISKYHCVEKKMNQLSKL